MKASSKIIEFANGIKTASRVRTMSNAINNVHQRASVREASNAHTSSKTNVSIFTRMTSLFLAFALSVTMIPAAALPALYEAYADESATQEQAQGMPEQGSPAGSVELAAPAEASAGAKRVSETVALGVPANASDGGDVDIVSASVSLESGASGATFAFGGLLFRISDEEVTTGEGAGAAGDADGVAEDEDATKDEDGAAEAILVGWSESDAPEGELAVPARAYSGSAEYAVTGVSIEGESVAAGVASISLPEAVESVAAETLSAFPNATAIAVAEENETLVSVGGIVYSADGATLVAAPAGIGASVTIPETCTAIAQGAFYSCAGLRSIVALGGVVDIALAQPGDANGDGEVEEGEITAAPAFNDETVADATVVLKEGAGRVAWEAAGFTNFTKPAEPGVTGFAEPAETTETGVTSFVVPVVEGLIELNKPGAEDSLESGEATESEEPAAEGLGEAAETDSADAPEQTEQAEGPVGFAYALLDDYTLSVGWTGGMGTAPAALEIPKTGEIDGVTYPVSTVAENGFAGQASLDTVVLPESVTCLGNGAFAGCSKLRGVSLGGQVTTIGDSAFEGTALLSLVLPASVRVVGAAALGNLDGTTVVVMGDAADVSPAALMGSAGVSVYVPYREDGACAWDAGLPAQGNHVLPYGVRLGSDAYDVEVGQVVDLFDGGYLLAPGDVRPVYSYKGKYLRVDADAGRMEVLKAGSFGIEVGLALEIEEAAPCGVAVRELPLD